MELLGSRPSLFSDSGVHTSPRQAQTSTQQVIRTVKSFNTQHLAYAYAIIIVQVIIYGFRPIHRLKLRHLPGTIFLEQVA